MDATLCDRGIIGIHFTWSELAYTACVSVWICGDTFAMYVYKKGRN